MGAKVWVAPVAAAANGAGEIHRRRAGGKHCWRNPDHGCSLMGGPGSCSATRAPACGCGTSGRK